MDLSYPHLRRFALAANELVVYFRANRANLINHGERFRAGKRISLAMAESMVNAVVSERFTKRQQMQWARRGAHLLLQLRTRALDGMLRPLFERWHPGLANGNTPNSDHVAAA